MRSVRPPPPRVDPDPFYGRVVRAGDVHRAATPLGGYGRGGSSPLSSYWNLVRPSRTAPHPTAASRRYAAAAALRDLLLNEYEIERAAAAYQIRRDVRDRFADADEVADDVADEQAERVEADATRRVGYAAYHGGAADLPPWSAPALVKTTAGAVVIPVARSTGGEALARRRFAALAAHGGERREEPAAKRLKWQLDVDEKTDKKRRKTKEEADTAQKHLEEEEECKSGNNDEDQSDGIVSATAPAPLPRRWQSTNSCAAPAAKFHCCFLVEDDSTEHDSRATPAPAKQLRWPPEDAQVVEVETKKMKTTEGEGDEKKQKRSGTDASSSSAVAPTHIHFEERKIENDTKRGDTATPKPNAAAAAPHQAVMPPVLRRSVNRGGIARADTFPFKFHRTLDAIEHGGHAHILSWFPHGRAFKVHDPKEFAALIARHYFGMAKATSFTRQLNIWGFTRITSGVDKSGYYHPLFLRGRIDLVDGIERKENKGTGNGRKKEVPGLDPNFYKMPPIELMPPSSELARLAKLNAQIRTTSAGAGTRVRAVTAAPQARPLHPPIFGPYRYQDRSYSSSGSGNSGLGNGRSSSSDRFCDAPKDGVAVDPAAAAAAAPHRVSHRQPPPVRPPPQHQQRDGGRRLPPPAYSARIAVVPPHPPGALTAPPARPLHPPIFGPNRYQDRSYSSSGSGNSGLGNGRSSSSDRFCDAPKDGVAVDPAAAAAAAPHRVSHRQPPPLRPPPQHQHRDGGRRLLPPAYSARIAVVPPHPPGIPPSVRTLTPEEAEASAAVAAARSHRVVAAAAAARVFEHDLSGTCYYPPPVAAASGHSLDRARFTGGEAHVATALRAVDGGNLGLEYYSRFSPPQQAVPVPPRRRAAAGADRSATTVAGEESLRVRVALELRRRDIYRVEEEAALALRYAREEEALLVYQPRPQPPRLPSHPPPPPRFRVAARLPEG